MVINFKSGVTSKPPSKLFGSTTWPITRASEFPKPDGALRPMAKAD